MLFICILFLLYLLVKHLYFYILYIPKHTSGFIEVTGLETQKEPSDLYLHSQTILYTVLGLKHHKGVSCLYKDCRVAEYVCT